MRVNQCKLIEVPTMFDESGDLSFIESNRHAPFAIERVYYTYNVPQQTQRGGHAHRALEQLIIAPNGSFEVTLDDGVNKKIVTLDSPNKCLYICPMIWRVLNNFTPGSVCLVLASAHYDEQDYFREYADFQKALKVSV